jgi:putative redox protein
MVVGRNIKTLAAELKSESHTFVSGISKSLGGSEEGPNPHEYLEAALTACTITTLQMYAARKNLKVTLIAVVTQIDSETKDGTVIIRTIKIEGELTEAERARLFEIADKCPIHKLLIGPIKITTNSATDI